MECMIEFYIEIFLKKKNSLGKHRKYLTFFFNQKNGLNMFFSHENPKKKISYKKYGYFFSIEIKIVI